MECNKDASTLADFVKRDRIFEFLSGLNLEFDPIEVQILGEEKIPSLFDAFYTVRGEKGHRAIMLDDKPTAGLLWQQARQPSQDFHPLQSLMRQSLVCLLQEA